MGSGHTEAVMNLLNAAQAGDNAAVSRLYEVLYPELRHLARSRLRRGQPLTQLDTTALVHESFLRLVKTDQIDIPSKSHFFAYAARVMRSIIIDFIRHKQAERRGGQEVRLTLNTDIADSIPACEDEVIRVSEALDELAKIDARAVQVVEMRYFAGMTEPEIACTLGITERTVRRDWQKAKLLLQVALA
jgi:RNA polymerase sigma factor (TIGR02999 family)